jgi:hypothetical protein
MRQIAVTAALAAIVFAHTARSAEDVAVDAQRQGNVLAITASCNPCPIAVDLANSDRL